MGDLGGAVYNSGVLTFEQSVLFHNNSGSEGGAMWIDTATFKGEAVFTSNSARFGGAMLVGATATFEAKSFFYDNTACTQQPVPVPLHLSHFMFPTYC